MEAVITYQNRNRLLTKHVFLVKRKLYLFKIQNLLTIYFTAEIINFINW